MSDRVPKAHVGDKVPKPPPVRRREVADDKAMDVRMTKETLLKTRPRIIGVTAVENMLTEVGCICCGSMEDGGRVKHRPGCLYLAYLRAHDEAMSLRGRLRMAQETLHDLRQIANSALRNVRY